MYDILIMRTIGGKKSTEPQISIVQRMLLYVRIANSFSDNSHFSSRRIVFIQKYPRNFTSSLQQLKVHLPQPNIKFLRLIRNHPYDRRFPPKCYVNSTFLQTHLIKVTEYRSLAKESSLIKADKEVKKVSWS